MNDKASRPLSPPRQKARRLKTVARVVLATGITSAGMVYWMGTRGEDLSGDPSMLGYNRAEARQMEILYGKQGELLENWSNDLKQPGTQAVLIAAGAILIAAGCFYFARLSEDDEETG